MTLYDQLRLVRLESGIQVYESASTFRETKTIRLPD
jgi:hypothetical protein